MGDFYKFLWSSQNVWTFMLSVYFIFIHFGKVNSVQEAGAKCFTVHILKFEIKWKNETKNIILVCQFFINKSSIWMLFVLFFMRFARFLILISELQRIWRKLLVLSLQITEELYLINFFDIFQFWKYCC